MGELVTFENFSAFLVPETTKGVLAVPTSADTISLLENPELPNQPGGGFEPIVEAVATRSATGQVRKAQGEGTVKLNACFRPSGAPGTPPAEARLLTALFGKEEVLPAANVKYSPSFLKGSYSLWMRAGELIFFAAGLTVTKGKIAQKKGSAATLACESSFMRRGAVGKASVTEAAAPTSSVITLDDVEMMHVGTLISVGADTNDGNGYLIAAIDTTTKAVTLTTGIISAAAPGATVLGYLPNAVIVGTPCELMFTVKVGGTPIPWSSWEISIEEPASFITDEVPANPDDEDYPIGFINKARVVTAKFEANMRTDSALRLKQNRATTDFDISLNHRNIPDGQRVQVWMDECKVDVGEISGGDASVKVAVTMTAFSTTGETEVFAEYS